MYLKAVQVLVALFITAQVYAGTLAGHEEVCFFRARAAQAIAEKKIGLKTQFDVVGALGVLEGDFDSNPQENSRLILGMLIGNGFKAGVTSTLKASDSDIKIMRRIAQKAAAYIQGLEFTKDQVWHENKADAYAVDQHITTLNSWVASVNSNALAPEHKKVAATQYTNLDQLLDNSLVKGALAMNKSAFILIFSRLSEADQAEITANYQAAPDRDAALNVIDRNCQTLEQAQNFAEQERQKFRVTYAPPQITATPDLVALIAMSNLKKGNIVKRLTKDAPLKKRNIVKGLTKDAPDVPNREYFLRAFNWYTTTQSKEGFLNHITAEIDALFPKVIRSNIQTQISNIPDAPLFKSRLEAIRFFNNAAIGNCRDAIDNLPRELGVSDIEYAIEKDVHYRALIAKIRTIVPIFDIARKKYESNADFIARAEEISMQFQQNHERFIISLVNSRITAITPPKVRLNPDYAAELLPAATDYKDAFTTVAAVAAESRPNRRAFEKRLIKYVVDFWSAYYKPEGDAVAVNTQQLQDIIQRCFNSINEMPLTSVKKINFKIALVESVLSQFLDYAPESVNYSGDTTILEGLFSQTKRTWIRNSRQSHVYTNMEKIKALPFVDWDYALERYVFTTKPFLNKSPSETDVHYWRRVGDYCISVYDSKIKSHIYPVNISASLSGNEDVPLVPLSLMFPGGDDDAFTVIDVRGKNLHQEILDFEITPTNLGAKNDVFKQYLESIYRKVNDYMMKTLVQLFGTNHQITPDLLWDWSFLNQFSQERIELCKKTLFIFAYFDRDGNNYDGDIPDIAALSGRFTHCADGKKNGIEAVADRSLCSLTGIEGIEEKDFDAFVKKRVLHDFKNKTIAALAGHDHAENVSIITYIKFRHRNFWNVPTAVDATYHNYNQTDYWLGDYDNTDKMLQYSYQHIYAGPHELVNSIYKYLGSATPENRAKFIQLTGEMLKTHRPFSDWEDDLAIEDFTELVKERYCQIIRPNVGEAAAAPKPDYMLTRKGLRTILFYAGYLNWNADANKHLLINGDANEHPLISDWNLNLEWLRKYDKQKGTTKYQTIYH